MPTRRCGGHALVPVAMLAGACLAAAGDPARAESPGAAAGNGPVYEMRLDLSLNPTRTDETSTANTRIVHGMKADSGRWPSAVSLAILKEGSKADALCAGTVIDPHWILTAAHCVFDRHRGGVRSLRAVTAYSSSDAPHQGEPRRVRSVVAHPEFAIVLRPGKASPGLVNDIALLELEAPAVAPPQALLADTGQPTVLAAGTMATVVGWGLTKPRRPDQRSDLAHRSKVLLRADIPVAGRSACDAFLAFPGDAPTDAVFCAGDGRGGADACNGDSGGPIFVPGPAGRPLQAGVVSWGEGCASPGAYGAYTAVGRFEPWIRRYAPQAQWIAPGAATPALAALSGATAGGTPPGHIEADLLALPPKPAADTAVSPPVRLRIVGLSEAGRQRIAASLKEVSVVAEGEAAALTWDARRQLVLNEHGQRIAEDIDVGRLQHAIDRQRALDLLVGLAAGSGLDVKLRHAGVSAGAGASADTTHKAGSRLLIEVGGVRDGDYVAVFNLTGSGKVEPIAPQPAQSACGVAGCEQGGRKIAGVPIGPFEVEVRAPFGADHVIAVSGTQPLRRLMPAVAKADDRLTAANLVAALARELQSQSLQAGVRGIYSVRE